MCPNWFSIRTPSLWNPAEFFPQEPQCEASSVFISITRAFQRYQNLAAPNFFKVQSQIWSYVLHNHLQKCNATSDITGGKTRENVLNRANFQTLVTFLPQVRQVEAIDMFIMKVNTCNGAKTALGIFNSRSKPNSTRLIWEGELWVLVNLRFTYM